MDNLWADIYFFFVPRRLTWEHWQEFMGENTADEWTEKRSWTIPQLQAPTNGWTKGSLGEKIYGVQGVGGFSVDAQYMRSYVAIFNEWFRNQNVTEMASMSKGDALTYGSNGTNYVTDLEKGGKMAKAVKYADYFTRALPSPQKGPDIYVPINTSGAAPVYTDSTDIPNAKLKKTSIHMGVFADAGSPITVPAGEHRILYHNDSVISASSTGVTGQLTASKWYDTSEAGNNNLYWVPKNLYAAVNETGLGASINELRQAFAVQRMYELDARGGWA